MIVSDLNKMDTRSFSPLRQSARPPEDPCDRCRDSAVQISCLACGGSHLEAMRFCLECDQIVHQIVYKHSHVRTRLGGGAGASLGSTLQSTSRMPPPREEPARRHDTSVKKQLQGSLRKLAPADSSRGRNAEESSRKRLAGSFQGTFSQSAIQPQQNYFSKEYVDDLVNFHTRERDAYRAKILSLESDLERQRDDFGVQVATLERQVERSRYQQDYVERLHSQNA